ncbi:amine oxidase [flavin-containing] A isoform X2 [Ctenopharyngodon idella]|uniref:amine oxidase [flavin-containing] A isoform X2 n=1 Tax=Ctenopharyngodon idella TaxID=7959 RepID=UPI00223208EC|nr:amine oxidase [flavin-containing] A isoform X2 [Ctenopharyngodon idella]
MSEDQFDVVVVGAGLSGLSAARRLQKRNAQLRVLVLEARDRVGGRTVSEDLPAANGVDQWDMGGQWVSSSQTHVMELIQELGVEVFPQYTEGKKVHHMGGPHSKIKTYASSIPSYSPLILLDFTQILWRIDRLTKTISVEDPMSSPNAELYDSMTLYSFMEKHIWSTQVKEEISLCSRIVFGLEASQVSFLYFLMYSAAAGGTLRLLETTPGSGQELRVKGGTQQLSEKLVEQIGAERVRLGAAVTTICQDSENIKVTTSAGTVTCKAVIVACPSHLAAKIHFEPALPAERQSLIQCLPMGHMTKFIVTYPTMEERRDAVISSLVKYLGPEASTYIHYREKEWAKEEYSGGCPVNVMTPGMLTYYHPSLRKPFGRIHWAGAETATQWCGYISGAIQSGQRAAMEVLAQMCPSSLSREELDAVQASLKPSDPRKESKCKSSKSYCLLGVVMTAAALVAAYLLAKPELGFKWI